jgi:hypothetical protein
MDFAVEAHVNENGEHYIEVRPFSLLSHGSDVATPSAIEQTKSDGPGIQRVHSD